MKYMSHLYLSSAITDDALYTITRPKQTMATIVKNRIQSVFIAAPLLQTPYQFFKHPPAMLEAFKLIETRAGRRQQRPTSPGMAREGRPLLRGRLRRIAPAAALELLGDFRRRRADHQHRLAFCRSFCRSSVIAILIFAAKNDPQPPGNASTAL